MLTLLGIAHVPMLEVMLLENGLDKWSARHARGPLPVACACRVKPTNATIAKRAVCVNGCGDEARDRGTLLKKQTYRF